MQADVEVNRISLADFPLPIYDGDLQARSGVPKSAINLKHMIGSHHGILIVTPEYNSSLPPLLKNAIDWVSRVQERARNARSGVSGARVCNRVGFRRTFRRDAVSGRAAPDAHRCRATVIPNQLALSFAGEAYDDMERLKHPADADALRAMVRQLIDAAQQHDVR